MVIRIVFRFNGRSFEFVDLTEEVFLFLRPFLCTDFRCFRKFTDIRFRLVKAITEVTERCIGLFVFFKSFVTLRGDFVEFERQVIFFGLNRVQLLFADNSS